MSRRSPAPPAARRPSTTRAALLDDGADRRFRLFVQDLFAVSAQVNALRENFAVIAGITGPQYSILASVAHLSATGSGLSVGRLASYLHISGTYVTAESKKLEQRGFLARAPDPDDRRVVLLRLTPEGEALMDDLLPAVVTVNDEFFRDLGRKEFGVLCDAISNMVRAGEDALVAVQPFVRKRRPK